ncbi:hypothetical protein [Helicobacter equorum]|uniref:hypothetical protein n=1 Tax=Helicobacter equorum TaxID=361872 RepID=UPI000E1F5318|nr:hypothetical protein [Helicobacter equorum]
MKHILQNIVINVPCFLMVWYQYLRISNKMWLFSYARYVGIITIKPKIRAKEVIVDMILIKDLQICYLYAICAIYNPR